MAVALGGNDVPLWAAEGIAATQLDLDESDEDEIVADAVSAGDLTPEQLPDPATHAVGDGKRLKDDERLWSDVWDSVERAPEPGSWSPRRLVPPPEAEAGAAPGRAPPWELPCYQRRTPERAKPAPLTPEVPSPEPAPPREAAEPTQQLPWDHELDRALSQIMEEDLEAEELGYGDSMAPSTELGTPLALGRLPATPSSASSATPLTLMLTPSKNMTTSSNWEQLWAQLLHRGWKIDHGPRGDAYYLPPGVRRAPGFKNREHYFDSKLQVFRHLRDAGRVVVEVTAEETQGALEAPRPKAPRGRGRGSGRGRGAGARLGAGEAAPSAPSSAGEAPCAAVSTPRPSGEAADGWAQTWALLTSKGWRIERGPRGDSAGQAYYMPPNVRRGPGARVRVDYFDSKSQVMKYCRDRLGVKGGCPAVLRRAEPEHAPAKRPRGAATAPFAVVEATGWKTAAAEATGAAAAVAVLKRGRGRPRKA